MANNLKTILVLGSVLVAGMAMAQQGGPAGQQRGGGQQRGFGAMMSSPIFLIGRADVQKDIKLTEEQKTKLTALRDEFPMLGRGQGGGQGGAGRGQGGQGGGQQGGGQGGGQGQGGQGGGQRMDQEAMQEMMKKAEAAINDILTDEQEMRMKQIGLQLGGASVFAREDVQKELALTVDQKKSIMDLQEQQQAANMELRQRVQNQEITGQEAGELRSKNDKILLDSIMKLLDSTQVAKYEAMKGAKFTPDAPQGRGGGN